MIPKLITINNYNDGYYNNNSDKAKLEYENKNLKIKK
jgi:hypothetical protein